MANGVTTEWEDLQVKHGNFIEREKVETLSENYQKNLQKLDNYNPLGHKTKQELQELEDEFDKDEEEFLNQYMKTRLEQLQQQEDQRNHARFGKVYEIIREDYVQEVTDASREVFVILHLYQDYIQESVLMNQILEQLAQQQPTIKFVKMIATKCTERFPDDQVSCLLIYRNAKIVSNLPKVQSLLRKLTVYSVETLLKSQGKKNLNHTIFQIGVIPLEGKIDSDDEQVQQMKNPYKNYQKQHEEDEQDREYSNNMKFYRKY